MTTQPIAEHNDGSGYFYTVRHARRRFGFQIHGDDNRVISRSELDFESYAEAADAWSTVRPVASVAVARRAQCFAMIDFMVAPALRGFAISRLRSVYAWIDACPRGSV